MKTFPDEQMLGELITCVMRNAEEVLNVEAKGD